jgi:plastocyanin
LILPFFDAVCSFVNISFNVHKPSELTIFVSMKKQLHLLSILFLLASASHATVYTINNSGFTFSPPNITILDGDSIRFVIGGSHDAREVSQATYQANGNTALPGGFQTNFGGGLLLPSQLPVGIHYYVCTPHAGFGMKGAIEVIGSTGIKPTPDDIQLAVFPNPAQENIVITAPLSLAGTLYRIVNAEGRTVKQGLFNGGAQSVPVADLPAGYYMVAPGCADRKPVDFIKQ